MMTIALLASLLVGDETLVLKEKVVVEGRYVRLLDVVEVRGDAAKLAGLYLGRAPEEGRVRIIEADEIRRALEGQGLAWAVSGEKSEVRAAEAAVPAGVRALAAAAVKRHVLERRPDLRGDQVVVRLSFPSGARCAEGARVAGVSTRAEAGFGAAEFTVEILSEGRRVEMPVTARVERARGSTRGAAVRKGEIVRAVSAHFEVDARAVADGGVGDEIALEVVSNRNRIRGRVTDAGRVEVEEGR